MYFYRKIMSDEKREEAFVAKQRQDFFWAAGRKFKKTKAGYKEAKKVTQTKINEMIRMGTGRQIKIKNQEKFASIEKNSYVCNVIKEKNK